MKLLGDFENLWRIWFCINPNIKEVFGETDGSLRNGVSSLNILKEILEEE